ncbi:hypothetical protein Goari_000810, partial [Gossypium aridum]|nr:hypothetical protein [Gossypium aridum]
MEEDLANLRLVDDEEEAIQEDATTHPIGGICITDIGEKWYLFQFFHEVDIARVLAGTP